MKFIMEENKNLQFFPDNGRNSFGLSHNYSDMVCENRIVRFRRNTLRETLFHRNGIEWKSSGFGQVFLDYGKLFSTVAIKTASHASGKTHEKKNVYEKKNDNFEFFSLFKAGKVLDNRQFFWEELSKVHPTCGEEHFEEK